MTQSAAVRNNVHPPGAVDSKQSRRSLRASTIGQLLEWYEWSSYAVFAPFIAVAMFDKSNPASAL